MVRIRRGGGHQSALDRLDRELRIIDAIAPFLGEGRNHGFFPTGGGNDFTAVRPSTERGCIELMVGDLAYIVRPRRLRLERFVDDLPESFLFLELDELEPSGVYERPTDEEFERETDPCPHLGVWHRGASWQARR